MRGAGVSLKQPCENLARTHDDVWVFTGPIFIGSRPIREIGASRVAVPTHFFKVILCVQADGSKEMYASVMPHIARLGAGLRRFAMTVDAVEQFAGVDFFSELPSAEEDELEQIKGELEVR